MGRLSRRLSRRLSPLSPLASIAPLTAFWRPSQGEMPVRAKMLRRLVVLAATWLAAAVPTARAATDIQLWHAMPGELGYQLDKLANDFNASQRDYRVVPVFKGLYSETMLAALFAMRLREHPAIVQVAEVATATMMAAKSAIIPVFELMRDEHEPFNPADYLPVIAG
jgi:sn-glycerol 3-phosphate transport system substrate-binding protein